MKSVLLLASALIGASTFAAGKTYQVTGPVLDVTDSTVVVQKGSEKWELNKSATTKVTGEIKKGAKITATYKMDADSIEVKPEKAGKK
jgi:hypothetical protein